MVKVGDKVSVNYTGKLEDGTVFDSSIGREPLDFEVGAGQMIKGFDSAVLGMKVGETKTVKIEPQDAYGMADSRKVISIDSKLFPEFSKLQVGMTVRSNAGLVGRVTQKNEKTAHIDFNHELAGKKLIFEITLVSIS